MKKRLSLVIAFLLGFGGILSGQNVFNVNGTVTDSKNQPVNGVSISILNSNRFTNSNSKGEFVFKGLNSGSYILSISSIGFASKQYQFTINKKDESIAIVLEESSNRLDEVVVSAEKREVALSRIPASVSALNSQKVADYRLWQANEITAIIPNLYSGNSGDDRNVSSIRGITTTSYDPAVATYIDGVSQFGLDTYIPALIDIERIEVLRGPQGTLYGRNAMGGVINIITKQPGNKPSSSYELSVGNYGQQRYSFSERTGFFNNKLFIGIAGLVQRRNGYYKNEFNGKSYDKQRSVTGNYFLRYKFNDRWTAQVNLKHHNNRNDGAFPLVADLQEAFDNPFVLSQNALAKMVDNTLNSSLSVNYSGSRFNFSSQTAHQSNYRYYNSPLDGDFSPIDGVTVINDYGKNWNNVKVFTQEFRLNSPANSSSPLNWTTGLYFFRQDNPVKQATRFGENADLLGVPDKNFSVINTNKGKSTGLAGFGQISYQITPSLSLIAGARWDYENKESTVLGEYQKDPDPIVVVRPDTSASVTYNAFSPKIGLAYQLNKSGMIYLNYSRGFRAGGLTQLSSDPSQPPLFTFDPEYSNNFELGTKNSFFDRRLTVNATVFFTRLTNSQVPTLILPDAITVTRNAGKLESKGFEIELAIKPVKNLQVDYNFGYTNAEYTTLKVSQNGNEVDLSGNKQIFTPANTSSLAVQYNIPLKKSGKSQLVFRGEWMQLGDQYFNLANTIKQKSYHLFNTRVGFQHKYWGLYFWGRNLTDEKYVSYAYDFGAVHLGNPLTWGLSLNFSF